MHSLDKKQDISLSEIFHVLFKAKLLIVLGTLVFAAISVAFSMYLPNQYKSKATIIINTESSSKLASLAGNLSGLAGMAGISLGKQDSSNPLIAKELVSSQKFILDFIEKNNVLVPLMAAKGWDSVNNKLILDASKYDAQHGIWLLGENPSKKSFPKRENIVKEFKEVIQLSEDSKTGIITLSAEFYSPALAQKWLEMFIDEINETIRQSDIEQSTKSISYLTDLINETENTHLLETFNTLIQEESKKLMLSKVRLDYVFKPIDPPNLPEKKSNPRRAIICIVGTFIGGFLMCFGVLVRYFLSHK
ncbi:LPS O-antigen length regulator [Thalassotalea sp. M1531]|uniref:LPS O-antigen length regulator n=1 Tax=Thalassotalea algicola TaxID=2716224 RepID=A0A7Y0Q7E3_9GAMM|nr:Wzz/FepE/Etk N-terminal domain-containing protein [Thalassotalea algicola]NMP32959.1 LPS O-antigen length regulator [Thalassotalea algicola]